MKKLLVLSVLYSTFISICNAEASFPQDTYLNALQNSHSTDFEISQGYEYSAPTNNNNNKYLPPTPIYGPPAPIYGPPPSFYKPAAVAFHPRDDWFWNKIKTKINLFTIGKIVLKLLIFKKIIKFIGLICLLMFLPKLKDLFKDDMSLEDEGLMDSKKFKTEKDVLQEQLDDLYKFAIKSFASYQK